MEPKSPSKSKLPVSGSVQSGQYWKIGMTLLVLLVIVGIYLVFRSSRVDNVLNGSYFTVVVDCGSTGTRVNVYKWRNVGAVSNQNLPILLHSYPDNSTKGGCEYHCMQTEPGLDNFVGNESGVRASLEPLFIWAEQRVPLERHGDTPVFVLGTAGLRRLPVDDGRQILKDVERVVMEHRFLCRRSWIRVLSGKEEAYYGWVALNYQMGLFGNSLRLPTLGLLDLGGSSLQVVAALNESTEDEHVFKSRIGSVEHQIFAYSFPAFGLNEAFDRTVIMLSHTQELRESAGGRFELNHPCLGSGLVQNYTCHGCFGKKKDNEVNAILLVGDPNWEKCKGLARAAATNLSSSYWSPLTNDSNCMGLSIYNGKNELKLTAFTRSVARFHALSGFFAVYSMLNLSQRANLTKVWDEGQQLCARSWAGLPSNFTNQKYAGQYCFRLPYLAAIIEDALCLGDKEITFGPGDVSWTLGAALLEGESMRLGTAKAHADILAPGNNWPNEAPYARQEGAVIDTLEEFKFAPWMYWNNLKNSRLMRSASNAEKE
ncbi:hypothetical protein RJ639_032728 [Escallonia herrerae]|uniref:Apyrase n=1 Tax=Escallonia herrerae TaxID=1293975 RepID=A0AA88WVA7_9ASTE|nr:hypothetical protein RJ639_032728 [Escallonia herrerae]